MSDLESRTGNVFEFKIMSVKPDRHAVLDPFSIVSLSSRPGSPKETPVSSQPCETWRFLMLISLTDFFIILSEIS